MELERLDVDLTAVFGALPEVVWGMAAGSFFSVLAVVLTNKANLRRLRLQLEHDREEKRKDRDLVLRRHLYLEAATAVSLGVDAVGSLGDLNTSVQKLMGPAIDRTAAITKVYLVASEDTIAALARFVRDLSSAQARLLPMRLKLDSINEQIGHIGRALQRASEERDHILAAMKRHDAAGASDQHRWEALQERLDVENAKIDDLSERRKQLMDELLSAQTELLTSCRTAVKKLNTLLIPVIKSIRRELDISLDENVLFNVIDEEYRSQLEPMTDFLQQAAAAKDAS